MYPSYYYVHDKHFRLDDIPQCNLIISLASHRLRVAYMHPVNKRCMGLEIYPLRLAMEDQAMLTKLQVFFQKHAFLSKTIWKNVVIGVENQQYTLMPAPFFETRMRMDYLQLAVGITAATVAHCRDLVTGMVVVFGVPIQLLNWLQNLYGIERCCTVHQANMMVAMHKAYLQRTVHPVMAYTEPGAIHISVIEQQKLLYYNRFICNPPRNYVPYLSMVMNHLQPTLTLPAAMVMGSITQDKANYKKFRTYWPNLSLVDQPLGGLQFSSNFKKSVVGQHLDIINLLPATSYLTTLAFN
jgi:hypothetical protein